MVKNRRGWDAPLNEGRLGMGVLQLPANIGGMLKWDKTGIWKLLLKMQ
jgi:hypothetical protein